MSPLFNRLGRQLDQQFTNCLPGIPEVSRRPTQTPGVAWHKVLPTPVKQPKLLAYFPEVAAELGLSPADFNQQDTLAWLAGNKNIPEAIPYAACYGGHQFGHWAGQLGDGRAITIAELKINQQRFECQLKGAGPTPYSRTADGRAVLRSSIREFLCSEAMFHLGVPTTRALSLVSSGEEVVRDILYNGNPKSEPGAIVCRVAPSFVRFGNFEIFAARQESELLKQFLNFVINRDFPYIANTEKSDDEKTAHFFTEVCRKTAEMIVHWQRVGFVHGVMNTDNMSILGLTIDYGPYGWLDNFDTQWTPNTTDAQNRRYRFGQQPAIARWNLICLANALATIIRDIEIFKTGIQLFDLTLNEGLFEMQCHKFGLKLEKHYEKQNANIIEQGYQLLQQHKMDFTLFFSTLTEQARQMDFIIGENVEQLASTSYESNQAVTNALFNWFTEFKELVSEQKIIETERASMMSKANPKFILRNYLSQQAIEKAESGDYEELETLMDLLRTPYQEQTDKQAYYSKRPDWAENKVGCSMLSCSS